MIERTEVDQRPATVAYWTETFEPADRDSAKLVNIKFDDTGESLWLTRSTPLGDAAISGEPGEGDLEAFNRARGLDRLGYLEGLTDLKFVDDHDQWNAQYDTDLDAVIVQGKFADKEPKDKVRTFVHEGGHRGQTKKDKITFELFKYVRLATLENFLAIASETHQKDYRRTGHVSDLPGEVFAESYARFILGLEQPERLRDFWQARAGDEQGPGSKRGAQGDQSPS